MKRSIIIVIAVAVAAPAVAGAQEGGALTTLERKLVEQGAVMARAVETKITTGRPYSAEAVTETVQVLGDGNRINRRSATKVYRDGEGRTRREVLTDDGSVRSVSISDPVSHTSYALDPKAKTAFKGGGTVVMPLPTPGSPVTIAERRLVEQAAAGGGGGRGGRGAVVMPRQAAPDNPNVRKEELGLQNVEGVMAAGSRTTTVIPAGEIGNAQEIRIVSEQWFSDELQVLVMTRHSDPRTGETTYRLRDILRAEPDASLFTVPPDYTVQQRGIRRPE
jgi:hypothetical protein